MSTRPSHAVQLVAQRRIGHHLLGYVAQFIQHLGLELGRIAGLDQQPHQLLRQIPDPVHGAPAMGGDVALDKLGEQKGDGEGVGVQPGAQLNLDQVGVVGVEIHQTFLFSAIKPFPYVSGVGRRGKRGGGAG